MPRYRYEHLEQTLKQLIVGGYLKPGDRLPSIRKLCAQYEVSKATVIHALHRLEAEHLIRAQAKSGYYVCLQKPAHPRPLRVSTPKEPAPVSVPAIFQDIMSRSAAFDILPAPGRSDSPSDSIIVLNRLIGRQMRNRPKQKTDYYDEPSGQYSLRSALSDLFRYRHLRVEADDICITSGCQHSLFIALMASCKSGDTVAVESPAFYGVLQIMQQLGLNIIEISSDSAHGLDVKELEEKLSQWPIKACVVTPNFGTPAGSSLTDDAREHLLDLAKKHDFWIIEDDIYGDLAFSSAPTQPLKALDSRQGDRQRVILCGSFSKSLSRDLRVGWILAGSLANKAIQLKLITQLASPQAVQEALANYLSEGHYRRHLNQYRSKLRQQRDHLIQFLADNWGDQLMFSQPEGGLCLWVQLPEAANSLKAYHDLREQNILLTPGPLFSAHGLYNNYLRLSFAQPITGQRREAIRQLFETLLS